MPRLAVDARRSTTGMLATTLGGLLLTVGLAVALQCRPRCHERSSTAILALPPSVTSALAPIQLGALIVPPAHADARPWPHGMVITPPPTADAINLAPRFDLAQIVDTVLSALLAPAPVTAS